jgi:hypothetical protein
MQPTGNRPGSDYRSHNSLTGRFSPGRFRAFGARCFAEVIRLAEEEGKGGHAMKTMALSALALLLTVGALRADPPGVVERIEKGGGQVFRAGKGPAAGRVDGVRMPRKATDASLDGLCELRLLWGLDLSDTEITDAGLARVAELRQLSLLLLQRTGVRDAGLRHLEALGELEELDRRRCPNVTPEGVGRLRKALPGCEIIH